MNLQPVKMRKEFAITLALALVLCLCFVGTVLAAQDDPVPVLVSTIPADGAVDVDPDSVITLIWDENIKLNPYYGDPNAFFEPLILKEKATNKLVEIALSTNGNQLTVTPNAPLKENTEYVMVIPEFLVETTAYVEVFNNHDAYMITFKTGTSEADESVVIEPISALILKFGETEAAPLVVVTNPEDADVTYESANEGIVTVDEDGLVQAVAPGTTTITVNASAAGYTDAEPVTVNVTVQAGDLVITGLPESLNLVVGGSSQQLNPVAEGATFSYESSNPDIATVTNGLVAPVAEGTATITVTASKANYNNDVATVAVTVTEAQIPEVALSVEPTVVSVEAGETATVVASSTDGATITYESLNDAVATVVDGIITGIAPGTTTIEVTATLEGYTPKTVIVNVTVTGVAPEEPEELQLTVSPAEVTLYVGATGQSFDLTTVVVPADAVLTYATSHAGLVTVSNGTLTAVAVGDATITVTASKEGYDNVEKTVAVTVAPVISGDVNLDGEVNVLDIQTAINISIERTVPTALQIEAADMNNDGQVNILDVVKIINLVMEAE
ncbi:MAG: Ig-like domain-containing protein [Dehalobacterium sp.]